MTYSKYSSYKDSGIEWLGDAPAHWTVDRLKWTVDACINGIWGDDPDGENDTVCIRVADFDRVRNRVAEGGYTYRSITPQKMNGRLLKSGDLLIEKSGGGEQQPVGVVVLFDHHFDAVTSNFVARMPVREGVNPNYLCYLHASLYSIRLNTCSIKQNTGIQNLDSGAYLNEKVALPPYDEQNIIATFLDRETGKIDALIAKQERLIALLQEKRQALISHTVTKGLNPDVQMKASGVEWLGEVPAHWEVKKLKYLASKIGSGKTPRGGSEVYVDDGIIFIRSQNVYNDGLRLDDVTYITSEIDGEMSNTRVLPEDILLNITGASIGRTCIVPDNIPRANVNQHVCIIRIENPDMRPFISLGMKSLSIKNQIDVFQNGAAREGLNHTQIGMLSIGVPPSDEQDAIVSFVIRETSQIDTLIGKAGSAVERLLERRSAVISAAVTGKIDVRNLVD
jgi:type I restriction enzyme S subunit